ncbi:hypothetical protein [Streptomyces cahuitamycinicus]|uniref:Integral membrane protein n=1 Tax=Streptomyces cahuitamycinicus TaxID=2070367 RepID=A0A2N8TSV0_9ACTN|nr:hypothetical protein [Streptomyces cahuitamycinicus]PNG22102.1 hypothetical protein C1J00_11105 [Streptomyces cahuitamycinicus]
MLLKTQLQALLRDGARGAERHDARHLQRSWRKFAAFAYVVEQYGYRYDGLSPLSPKGSPNPYFAFRRMPDAAERAARTAARFPDALDGGPLPGMRPGGQRLRPLPEARRDVDLLHARIMVDYSRTHRRRGLIALLLIPLVLLIPLSQTGFSGPALLVCAAVWLFFAGLRALGLLIARRRHRKYGEMLRAAGITRPQT